MPNRVITMTGPRTPPEQCRLPNRARSVRPGRLPDAPHLGDQLLQGSVELGTVRAQLPENLSDPLSRRPLTYGEVTTL